jgi:hypothetical protein
MKRSDKAIEDDLTLMMMQSHANYAYPLTEAELKAHFDDKIKAFIAQAVRERYSAWTPEECLTARAILNRRIKEQAPPVPQKGTHKK